MWALLFSLFTAFAGETTVEDIIAEARSRNTSERAIQQVRMVVVSRSGKELTRELEIKARRDDTGVRSMIEFTGPADVAGTKLLLVEPKEGTDEQLLYMPAFDKVQKISGSSRKGSFMGSDFSYEDLDLGGRPGDVHKLIEETETTWVIDTTPGEGSQYGRIRATIGRADYVTRSVQYYDTSDEPLKTLEVTSTKDVDGHIVPTQSIMTTLRKNTKTRLEVVDIQLDVTDEALPAASLTRDALESR